MDRLSPLLSQSRHITLDTHTVLVWTDLYAHTHLTKHTHSITLGDRAFRAVIPDIFKKFGQTAQKKKSVTQDEF